MTVATSRTAYLQNRQSVFNAKSDIPLLTDDIQKLLIPSFHEIDAKKNQLHAVFETTLKKPCTSIHYLPSSATFHLLFEAIDHQQRAYIIKTTKEMYPLKSHNFYIDQWIMNLLRTSNFPALQIYAVNCSRQQVNFDYLIMDKAPGQALIHFKSDEDLFNQNIHRLGTYLAYIHAIPTTQFGPLDAEKLAATGLCSGVAASWQDYILTRLEEHLQYCYNHQIIDAEQLATIKTIFSDHETCFLDRPSRLLHGDLNDHNVFIHEQQLITIDWEDAIAGDPVFDIALWGTFMHHHEKLPHLLDAYQLAGQLLPAEFSLLYWLYYLRIMIAKTIVRYKFEYYKTDKIPAIHRILPAIEAIKRLT